MIINTGIMARPLNWVTVFLMLLIAGIGGSLVLKLMKQEFSTAESNPAVIQKPAVEAA